MYILFLILICLGVGLLILQQQGKLTDRKTYRKLPPVERNIFNLEIGDLVQYEGIDWFIEGKLIYDDSSDTWFSYLLQNNNQICWLSVEEDDYVEVSIFHETTETIEQPLLQNVIYLGEKYYLLGSGTARMRRIGNTLNRQEQICNYYDYEKNDLRLSVEIWDGEMEVLIGQKINPRMLTFLPGDGQKVYS